MLSLRSTNATRTLNSQDQTNLINNANQPLKVINPSNTQGSMDITLENLSSTNATLGRDYNIFTRLRSSERKALEYINYDISGGIQAISFSILYKYSNDPKLFEKYPMLFEYAYDIQYKINMRQEISQALGIPISEAKSLLRLMRTGAQRAVINIRNLNNSQRSQIF